MDNLNTLKEALRSLSNEASELKERLSNLDLEEQDLLHFIEFGKINARDGYKLAKAIKEVRIKRRDIKNRFELIKNSLSLHITKERSIEEVFKIVESTINKAEESSKREKKYTTRIIDMESVVGRVLSK